MRSFVMLASLLWTQLALGADLYPARPVRLIVPWPAAASVDLTTRLIATQLAEQMGKPFVVENRAGASASLGTGAVATSAPDGYTLLSTEASLPMLPGLFKSLPYDVARDLTPITQYVGTSMALVVHPTVTARTAKEFIALAQASPGKLNYASPGAGTPVHLASELFKQAARINVVHVPYKGGGEMVTGVLTGQTQMLLATMTAVLPHIRSGKLRALAVTMDGRRSPALPDVPYMAEAGVSGMAISTWSGLLGPAGLPRDVVNRLHSEVLKALAVSSVRERFAADGADVVGNSPEEFARFIRAEIQRWGEVIRSAGITPE